VCVCVCTVTASVHAAVLRVELIKRGVNGVAIERDPRFDLRSKVRHGPAEGRAEGGVYI